MTYFSRTDTRRPPRSRVVLTLLISLLALLLPACFGDGADDIQAVAEGDGATEAGVADYPDWIQKVYPPPDSELSATRAVQVNHTVVTAERQVRLVIDGVDVTAYALETSPGLLEYDIDQVNAPVELRPGTHSAEALLFEVTPGASEGVDSYDPDVHEPVDTYSWTFEVL